MNQPKDQFVLFVPYWIAKVFDREKLTYNKLLNLTELRKHFSTEELSILYWLNRDHPLFNMTGDPQDELRDDIVLANVWTSHPEDTNFVFDRLVPMKDIAKQAIAARLSTEEQYSFDGKDKFQIVTMSESKLYFIVIVYPGMDITQQTTLSAALLKLLYAHTGYDDMARNHLFKGYIERLALANNAL